MTQYTIKATVDEQGHLILPAEIARRYQPGQQVTISLSSQPDNPFLAAIGTLPAIPGGNLQYLRDLKGPAEAPQQDNDKEEATTTTKRKPLMYINGQPIYPRPAPTEILTEEQVEQMAVRLTGDAAIARAWMDRPNVTLRGKTPREVTRAGEGQRAAGILRSF